jgi:hypothetical protein
MNFCPKCERLVNTIVTSEGCEVPEMTQYNERCNGIGKHLGCNEIISSRREKRA